MICTKTWRSRSHHVGLGHQGVGLPLSVGGRHYTFTERLGFGSAGEGPLSGRQSRAISLDAKDIRCEHLEDGTQQQRYRHHRSFSSDRGDGLSNVIVTLLTNPVWFGKERTEERKRDHHVGTQMGAPAKGLVVS